jgi:hypothetical protein
MGLKSRGNVRVVESTSLLVGIDVQVDSYATHAIAVLDWLKTNINVQELLENRVVLTINIYDIVSLEKKGKKIPKVLYNKIFIFLWVVVGFHFLRYTQLFHM